MLEYSLQFVLLSTTRHEGICIYVHVRKHSSRHDRHVLSSLLSILISRFNIYAKYVCLQEVPLNCY